MAIEEAHPGTMPLPRHGGPFLCHSDPPTCKIKGDCPMAEEIPGIREKAFEILVRQHHRRLLAYALSLVRDEAAAEDLAQEAFLEAYRSLSRFDPARDFGRWVRGILRNKYFEWARRRRIQVLPVETLEGLDGLHQSWDRSWEEGSGEVLDALRQCLSQLQSQARKIVDLFYFRKYDCAQVALRVACTEDAVKKRLERIRGVLGECVRRRLAVAGREERI